MLGLAVPARWVFGKKALHQTYNGLALNFRPHNFSMCLTTFPNRVKNVFSKQMGKFLSAHTLSKNTLYISIIYLDKKNLSEV